MFILIQYDDGWETVPVTLEDRVVSSGGEWIPGYLAEEPTRCHLKSDYFECALNEGHLRQGRVQPDAADTDDSGQPLFQGFTWMLVEAP